jgi:hypothetical protein
VRTLWQKDKEKDIDEQSKQGEIKRKKNYKKRLDTYLGYWFCCFRFLIVLSFFKMAELWEISYGEHLIHY